MKKLVTIILFAFSGIQLMAQNQYNTILKEIEKNSSTLIALREQVEVQKLSNRTGIYIANPEIEFHYLWGSLADMGNRIDISATQSFDFPTVYGHRSKISNLENANVELMYKSEKINLMLAAKKVCIELVYNNALVKEYSTRLKNAERLAETYQTRLNKGDANILEHNKAQLNLIAIQSEMDKIAIERTALLSELKRLNGGKELAFADDAYAAYTLPSDFDVWYAQAEKNSPALQYVKGEVEINQRQVKLQKAMSLPKFSAGYMSEKVLNEHFQGVVVGISVPLFENKNQVKQAKSQMRATELIQKDAQIQFYNRFQSLYFKSLQIQKTVSKYKQSLSKYNNEILLEKALDVGEISLLDYLMEIEYYYNTINKMVEAERDFELTVAELEAVEGN